MCTGNSFVSTATEPDGNAPARILFAKCAGKRCALTTVGGESEYADTYFLTAIFPDENSAVLAAKALTKLAQICTAR